jgi:hypothetical protein
MLSAREHDARERHLVLSLHGVADHYERVGTCLTVRYHVIWLIELSLIDILGGYEIVDFNRVRALEFYGLKLFFVDLDGSAL